MHLQPLRMHRITSYVQGANFSHIFEIPDPDLPVHYTTYGATMTFKGHLLLAPLMLKLFFGQ